MTTSVQTSDRAVSPYLCKHAQHPLEGCYCRRLNGKTVPNVVTYCMDRFRDCPIYRSQSTKG